MARSGDFLKQRTIAVLIAHGGVGDFLFQLDLAKRLELSGVETLFLVRKNYLFLSQILHSSNVTKSRLVKADGLSYVVAVVRVWALALTGKAVIINSFFFTHLRLPTRLLYFVTQLVGARVIVCTKAQAKVPYEQLVYESNELIWQRNNRIATYLTDAVREEGFPVLVFKKQLPALEAYVHIHPVASSLGKSYPPEKLLEALQMMGDQRHILLTMTPREESWYMTAGLRSYIASHPNIMFISKQFSFEEISGYIAQSRVFCTVNTGLLWLALMLGKKTVVCDIDTEYEWNPSPYGAIRLLQPQGAEAAKALSAN